MALLHEQSKRHLCWRRAADKRRDLCGPVVVVGPMLVSMDTPQCRPLCATGESGGGPSRGACGNVYVGCGERLIWGLLFKPTFSPLEKFQCH